MVEAVGVEPTSGMSATQVKPRVSSQVLFSRSAALETRLLSDERFIEFRSPQNHKRISSRL